MSRTHRIHPDWKMFRRPRTFNLVQQNQALLSDVRNEEFDYPISKMNRVHRFIPDAWDDIRISSNYEYQ